MNNKSLNSILQFDYVRRGEIRKYSPGDPSPPAPVTTENFIGHGSAQGPRPRTAGAGPRVVPSEPQGKR